MRPVTFGISVLLLWSLTAGAETPNANPSGTPTDPSSKTNYLLILHPSISKMISDTVHLGSKTQKTYSGCTITAAEDGAITCLFSDSCATNAGNQAPFPSCAIAFSSSPGLTISDIAELISPQQNGSTLHLGPASATGLVDLGASRDRVEALLKSMSG